MVVLKLSDAEEILWIQVLCQLLQPHSVAMGAGGGGRDA